MNADLIVPSITQWGYYAQKADAQLTVLQVVKAWVAGLREAGVKAANAREWSRGSKAYPIELPFVIEFDCPYGHRTEDRRRRATVRVIVEDNGWITFDEQSTCEQCDLSTIEWWLLSCPRCERGDRGVWHRTADHELSHKRGRLSNGETGVVGSTSPLSFVVGEFERLGRIAEARWWIGHTEAAAQALRADDGWAYTEEGLEERIATKIVNSTRLLASISAAPSSAASAPREGWTDESAAQWLDNQKGPNGQLVVAGSASQREAWRLAETIAGHPPKNVIERAQTLRKSRV